MRVYIDHLKQQEKKASLPVSKYKWIVIETDIFSPKEEILCVMDEAYLSQAQKENPGLITYLLEEIEIMKPVRDELDIIKKIHLLKKEFGGFVKDSKPLWTSPGAKVTT